MDHTIVQGLQTFRTYTPDEFLSKILPVTGWLTVYAVPVSADTDDAETPLAYRVDTLPDRNAIVITPHDGQKWHMRQYLPLLLDHAENVCCQDTANGPHETLVEEFTTVRQTAVSQRETLLREMPIIDVISWYRGLARQLAEELPE